MKKRFLIGKYIVSSCFAVSYSIYWFPGPVDICTSNGFLDLITAECILQEAELEESATKNTHLTVQVSDLQHRLAELEKVRFTVKLLNIRTPKKLL